MAVTAIERKLLIGGEWVETGEWLEVRSPYSGEVVGRVARAGAEEARRAVDAAERAMRDPLPAHTDQMPYGRVKDSGNTREGPAYAVREMTEERIVVLQL